MEQSESLEQAKEFARSAMSLMIAKKITTNPNNFTVWFHYFSNKYPDLRRTLEILLNNDQEFTASRNAEIFEKFFTFDEDKAAVDGERAAISEAASKIEMELVEILKYLGLAGDGAAEYGKVLEAFSGEKDAVKLAEKIRQRVSGKTVVNRKTGGDLGKITISIGVGAFDFGEPPGQLIARSDGALYTAKRTGRDRVVSQDEVQDKELAFGF